MRILIPSSRRTLRMKGGPFAASRSADVPAASKRRTPEPPAIARKSRNASKARSRASGGMRPVRSRSRASRSAARLPASTWRCPPASGWKTITRPEFEPMSTTAMGSRGLGRPDPNSLAHGEAQLTRSQAIRRLENRRAPGLYFPKNLTSATTLRFRMSPKMCCWTFSFVRFMPLRLTVTLPSANFMPRVALSIV